MSTRKSFIIHKDSLSILDDLSDEQAGQLFKAIKSYQLDEEKELSSLIKIAFSPFKNQFVRDAEKYLNTVERNRINGSKGGRPPNPENPEEPSGLIGNPTKPKKTDSGSKSDSDSKSDSKKENIPYQLFADAYNALFAESVGFGRVEKLTKKRESAIKKIWNFDNKNPDVNKLTNNLEYWQRYFSYCATRPFFQSDYPRSGDHKDWKPNFDFIIREDTLLGIKEGKY